MNVIRAFSRFHLHEESPLFPLSFRLSSFLPHPWRPPSRPVSYPDTAQSQKPAGSMGPADSLYFSTSDLQILAPVSPDRVVCRFAATPGAPYLRDLPTTPSFRSYGLLSTPLSRCVLQSPDCLASCPT